MYRKFVFLALLSLFLIPSQAQEERPLFFVHYMPWYQAPNVSGSWGWHWTMDHFQPNHRDEQGRPEIASHYIPLTGPYDSLDPAILEYQVLLMKMSGIDGVIADWYGTTNFRDYAGINRATLALFEYTQKAGLQFSLAYEDRTVGIMVESGRLSHETAVAHGQEVMAYAETNFMSNPSYLRFNEQPLLFIFGPLYYRDPAQWEELFSGLATNPALVTLDYNLSFTALGHYPWPPMHLSGGAELVQPVLESYLELFYRNTRRDDYKVGLAVPRFHDIYEEAGVRSSYGYLDDQDGAIFRRTFEMALAENPNLVQIVTWNDFGEGTTIEPTEEYGNDYLEIVQEERSAIDSSFSYTAADLELSLAIFNLRRANEGDATVNAELDRAFTAIVAGDTATAREIIENLSAN